MVHVLHELHGALRPGGLLLDIHPLPRHPQVEIWRGRRHIPIGPLDDTAGIQRIRAARKHLDTVVGDGLFVVEARRWFDNVIQYPSLDAWLRRREEYGSSSVIPQEVLTRTRVEMERPGTTLVLRERARATRLRQNGREDRADPGQRPRQGSAERER